MSQKKILIIGGGGHAKSLISVIKKSKMFKIIGYVDIKDHGRILGIPYLGTDQDLKRIAKKFRCFLAALGIGTTALSHKRRQIVEELTALGFQWPAIVSPTAIINEEVVLGQGTVVFDGAIINAGTSAGQGCIFNTGCIVDHDCAIGDFVHIAPGAVLSGGVVVGDNCLLGTGVKVIQCVSIARDCLIGAGAVVVKDIKKAGTYVGVPACLKKDRRA